MAGAQISTSVTVIDSLHGFQAVSLTEYTTSAACSIAAGSVVEIAGAFFTFVADEPIEASTWTSIVTATTAYIQLTASGSAGSQIVTASYTSTAPTWRDDMQGWYASAGSAVRVIGSVYKAEATQYTRKFLLDTTQQDYYRNYRWQGETVLLTTGSGLWTVPTGVYKLKVICVGGGGSGGGGNTNSGGGGGGGTLISNILKSTVFCLPGQNISYSVGIGGASVGTATTGITGSTTTFIGATSGLGGIGGGAGGSVVGGSGGAGPSGGAGSAGGTGGTGVSGVNTGLGGSGGGAGAQAGSSIAGYGGGGSGGSGDSGVNSQGKAGGSGIIIIEY